MRSLFDLTHAPLALSSKCRAMPSNYKRIPLPARRQGDPGAVRSPDRDPAAVLPRPVWLGCAGGLEPADRRGHGEAASVAAAFRPQVAPAGAAAVPAHRMRPLAPGRSLLHCWRVELHVFGTPSDRPGGVRFCTNAKAMARDGIESCNSCVFVHELECINAITKTDNLQTLSRWEACFGQPGLICCVIARLVYRKPVTPRQGLQVCTTTTGLSKHRHTKASDTGYPIHRRTAYCGGGEHKSFRVIALSCGAAALHWNRQ